MRILIDIGHPAHVHLFKNFALKMQKSGNAILFTCREKEFEIHLLKHYGFNFKSFGKKYNSSLGKFLGLIEFDIKEFIQGLKFKPDIFLSAGSMYAAQASYLLRKPHIALEDSENMEQIRLYKPFTDIILSPNSVIKQLGSKHIKYEGFHQSAYLRDDYFISSQDIYNYLKIEKNKKYYVLRFVALNASHDIGIETITLKQKIELINELNKYGKVFISSEKQLPDQLQKYKLDILPEKIHDVLYYADLFFSESGAMSNETAFLGTPSVLIFKRKLGVHDKYSSLGLKLHFLKYNNDVLEFIKKLLPDIDNYKTKCRKKSRQYIDRSIDLTEYLIWSVNNYPESKNFNFHKNTKWYSYVQ